MNLTEQYCALRALARSGGNLMLLWGDWSLHGLQAIPGMHGRFDERPCPAESARSPTADRAEPIRTPRNVAGNLPLPDADVPVPCARHAETCARVRERRRRKLRTPGRGICRLGRRLRISARHTVSLVGDGSRLAAARVSPLPASRRGASASLCALQAGVSGPMVMLRTWRASATLEAVRSSAAHGRAVSSRRHRVRDARPPNRRGPPVGRPSISRAPLRAVDPARRPLPRIPSCR
jgi:hypothetical protein